MVCDLAKAGAADELFARLPACDVLVNNAGFANNGAFAEIPENEILQEVQLDVVTLTELTRLYLAGMLERRSGKILNVASTAAFLPGPNMAVYYASKAYVLSLSEALAYETRGTGVTVTCLCPGATATDFHARAKVEGRYDARQNRRRSRNQQQTRCRRRPFITARFERSDLCKSRSQKITGFGFVREPPPATPNANPMRVFICALSALLFIAAAAPSYAQSPPVAPGTAPPAQGRSDVPTLSTPQMRQLLKALHQAFQKDDPTVMVAFKDPAQMPAYAPDWYYAGATPNGASKPFTVWLRKGMTKDQMEPAVVQSFILAVMDAGLAGTDLKALYDSSATKDTTAGSNAANPLANRQKLAAALYAQINRP